MRHLLNIIYIKTKINLIDIRRRNHLFIIWIGFVLSYLIIREVFGLHAIFIYGFLAILFLCRFSLLQISFTYFSLVLIMDFTGNQIEANNYMSYVFIFLILFLVKEYVVEFIKNGKVKS